MIAVSEPFPNGARWTFDGDLEKPTFKPSVRVRGVEHDAQGNAVRDAEGKPKQMQCHYVLTKGVINFCGDCTHGMAGQAVPLPPIPAQHQD